MKKGIIVTLFMITSFAISVTIKAENYFPIVGSAYQTEKGGCKVVRSKDAKKLRGCKPDVAQATGRPVWSCENGLPGSLTDSIWLFENMNECQAEWKDPD